MDVINMINVTVTYNDSTQVYNFDGCRCDAQRLVREILKNELYDEIIIRGKIDNPTDKEDVLDDVNNILISKTFPTTDDTSLPNDTINLTPIENSTTYTPIFAIPPSLSEGVFPT